MTVSAAPRGLTGLDPIPYGVKRWNGAVWPNIQVDRYNSELSRIASRHNAGMDTQALVDGLYNMAHGFDMAGQPVKPCQHVYPDRTVSDTALEFTCSQCGEVVAYW